MVACYLERDALFIERTQRFLAEHHRRFPLALFDTDGRYRFQSLNKLEVLTKSFLDAVARGRDNELFIIMADLIELEEHLAELLRAIRIARARHHHVVVICPWLSGIPADVPDNGNRLDATEIRRIALTAGFRGIEAVIFQETVSRYHRSYAFLAKEFGKAGVTFVRAQENESTRLILNRLDLARGVRARR
jgi:hypothetical protein